MNYSNHYYFNLIIILFLSGCNPPADENTESSTDSEPTTESQSLVTEVITNAMDFELPDSLPSGWHTFRYINKSEEVHFFVLEKMPDSIRFEDYKRDIFPPYLAANDLMIQGDPEAAMAQFADIPEWFSRVEVGGGVGLTSPQSTAEATFYLDPGTYVMECYVRMPNGTPHALVGMITELIITQEESEMDPPQADLEISLSTEGISFPDTLNSGDHMLSVQFVDQQKYEHMLGHDINLVRLEQGASLDSLAGWLNTVDFQAFRTPAPTGFDFLGGMEDLPAGQTGYFPASLEPGDYVLISEIPMALDRNMFHRFVVVP